MSGFSAVIRSHIKFLLPKRAAACNGTPFSVYSELLRSGVLKEDAQQKRVIQELTTLFDDIKRQKARKGMYIYGSPGSGKSMSMDLFHHCLMTEDFAARSKRLHFHEFMHDVHQRMHVFHALRRDQHFSEHVVKRTADEISAEVDILCFDEMNVTTVQDCALLSPLFQHLFTNGVTCVITSNRQPDDLYTDGLNRHMFLPPLLNKLYNNCHVIGVESRDYRAMKLQEDDGGAERVFHWSADDDAFVDQWITKLSGAEKAPTKRNLNVAYGRSMEVDVLNDTVGIFDFDQLCGRERALGHCSADDYFALAAHLPCFIVKNVRQLEIENHNEARRWTNFVDACYENQCRLILTLSCQPEDILKKLNPLTDMTMNKVGAGYIGASDFDSSNSSSAVLAAVDSVKAAIRGETRGDAKIPEIPPDTLAQLSNFDPAKDQEIWRQAKTRRHPNPLPQVSRSWDRRRRSAQFAWEGADPTAEQESVRGVFKAAVASLQETGFAAARMASRLQEMQTRDYQLACAAKRPLQYPKNDPLP